MIESKLEKINASLQSLEGNIKKMRMCNQLTLDALSTNSSSDTKSVNSLDEL